MCFGSCVTEFLPTLKGHFDVTLAILVKPVVLLSGLKDTVGKGRAHLNVAVNYGCIHFLCFAWRGIARLRVKMAAAVTVKGDDPAGWADTGIGEVGDDCGD